MHKLADLGDKGVPVCLYVLIILRLNRVVAVHGDVHLLDLAILHLQFFQGFTNVLPLAD